MGGGCFLEGSAGDIGRLAIAAGELLDPRSVKLVASAVCGEHAATIIIVGHPTISFELRVLSSLWDTYISTTSVPCDVRL